MGARILYVSAFLSATRNRSYCEDLADQLEAGGAQLIRTSTRPGRLARLADVLGTAWARRGAYDVAIVDVFSGLAFGWAEAACFELRRLGKPYVLTLHGGGLPEFAARWPRRVRWLLGSAAVVTAPSGFMRDQLRGARADIVVVPNAVDAGRFPFALRARPRPRLVWLRAFHAIYNPVLAIDVVARLVPRFPDLTLRMIGPDKADGSRAAVVDRARALGVTDRVELVGGITRAEVPAQLAAADVLLNTTDVDNAPVSVVEAAAAGLCLVSTSVGGIPHLLAHDRNALLVAPRDPVAMAAAVARVLDEPGLGARLSQAAHELARARDWPRVIEQWQHTLARVGDG